MILVFDTETTTFPSKDLPATDINQARIIQLAWLVLSDEFEEVGGFNSLIRLDSRYTISEGASKAHGITKEKCQKYGVSIEHALNLFDCVYSNMSIIVAHNIKFDATMLAIEYAIKTKLPANRSLPSDKYFCTMEAMTPICRLPPRFPGTTYKWPKLSEAYYHCFQKNFDKAHDALADVRATAAVYKWLQQRNKICQPTRIPITSTQ